MKNIPERVIPTLVLLAIVLISAAMHARHFNKELMGLHVWRQTETQTTINNFYAEDMNIFNPRRNDRGSGEGFHRMEFPLMQWLVAGIYKIFGKHLIISRLFMFITGMFSIFGMYRLGKKLFHKDIPALMGAWAFTFSPTFYYYTINPMPDNFALCLGIWGLVHFISWTNSPRGYKLYLSGFLLALSALTKLPFIFYFAMPVVYFFFLYQKASSRKPQAAMLHFSHPLARVAVICAFAILPLAWYITVIPGWKGNGIVQGILEIRGSGKVVLDNFIHHLFITLPELLLNYASVPFFLAAFYFLKKGGKFKTPLVIAFAILVVLLIFYVLFELNMIGKSHDYYLMPFLPLLFLLVAYGASNLYLQNSRWLKALVIVLLMIMPLTAYLRIDQRWNPEKPGFNKDLLIYKEDLRRAVPDDALCVAGNDLSHHIFFYYIDKKGWNFDYSNLDGEGLKKMRDEGAQYLYSDCREVEEREDVKKQLGELILERGSVKVFKIN